METVHPVIATPEAKALIDALKKEHGPLMFHLSGGCCDGSAPQCYPEGELLLDEQTDQDLGMVHGCSFHMAKDQYKHFKNSKMILDAVPGRGSSFSLEIPTGKRFLMKSDFCMVT